MSTLVPAQNIVLGHQNSDTGYTHIIIRGRLGRGMGSRWRILSLLRY